MTTEEMDLIESITRNASNINGSIEGYKYGQITVSDGGLKLIRNAAQFILNDVADILAIRSTRDNQQ